MNDVPNRLRDAADRVEPIPVSYDASTRWRWEGPTEYDSLVGRRDDWYPEHAPTLTVFYSGSGSMHDHWPPPVGWKIRYSDGTVGESPRNASLVEVMRLVPREFWGWLIDQHQQLREWVKQKMEWEIDRRDGRMASSTDDPHQVTAKHVGGAAMDLLRLAREFWEGQEFQLRNQPPPKLEDLPAMAQVLGRGEPEIPEHQKRFVSLSVDERAMKLTGIVDRWSLSKVPAVVGGATSGYQAWRIDVEPHKDDGVGPFHCINGSLGDVLLDALGQMSAFVDVR